jgi:hypothetical protein
MQSVLSKYSVIIFVKSWKRSYGFLKIKVKDRAKKKKDQSSLLRQFFVWRNR